MKYELNIFGAESIILLITINDYDTFLPLPTLWLLYCVHKIFPRNIYLPVSYRAKLQSSRAKLWDLLRHPNQCNPFLLLRKCSGTSGVSVSHTTGTAGRGWEKRRLTEMKLSEGLKSTLSWAWPASYTGQRMFGTVTRTSAENIEFFFSLIDM